MGWVIVDGGLFRFVVLSVRGGGVFGVARLGGGWGGGSYAGGFYWSLNNSVGGRYRYISSRLVNAWLISGSPKGLSVFI